ncbi:hypothetical protein ACTFIW_004979 [Dictyostelium discoideum]
MKLINICIFIFAIICIESTFGFYTDNSNVINLTKKNFQQQVLNSQQNWMVEFYAPWCGHCKSLKPEYEKVSNNLKGLVKIGAINCDEEKELCGQYQIQGFPTLKFFSTNPKTGKKGQPEDYQGARSASEIAKFSLSKLPSNHIQKVSQDNINKFLTGTSDAKALLFTDKPKTTDLYKALSVDFFKTLTLGEARNLNKETLEKFNIDKFPTLLVFTNDDGETFTKFDGKLTHSTIYKFLEPFSKKSNNDNNSNNNNEESTKTTKTTTTEKDPASEKFIEIKDEKSFEKSCSTGLCIVALFDQSSIDDKELNEKYLELLNTVSQNFIGRMKFVWVDVSVHDKIVPQFDLSGTPNIFVINNSKKRYTPFMGSFSDESLNSFFKSVLSGLKKAIPFTDSPKFNSQQKKQKDEL